MTGYLLLDILLALLCVFVVVFGGVFIVALSKAPHKMHAEQEAKIAELEAEIARLKRGEQR